MPSRLLVFHCVALIRVACPKRRPTATTDVPSRSSRAEIVARRPDFADGGEVAHASAFTVSDNDHAAGSATVSLRSARVSALSDIGSAGIHAGPSPTPSTVWIAATGSSAAIILISCALNSSSEAMARSSASSLPMARRTLTRRCASDCEPAMPRSASAAAITSTGTRITSSLAPKGRTVTSQRGSREIVSIVSACQSESASPGVSACSSSSEALRST